MFKEVDLILFMINVIEGLGWGDEFIIECLKDIKMFVFFVINKIDEIYSDELFLIIMNYKDLYFFVEIVLILVL